MKTAQRVCLNICGTGKGSGELAARSGQDDRCRTGPTLMRGKRWFAAWQCHRG